LGLVFARRRTHALADCRVCHFGLYKVWLEMNGKRICKVDGEMPNAVLKKLKAEVAKKRLHIEGRWTNCMIEQGWLQMRMRGTKITLIAYPNVSGSRFTRSIDLKEYLPGICDPDYPARRKEPIRPEQVVFGSTFPCLEIWPEKKESLRSHILLPPNLWED
jgi:hypothetical protein